MTSNKRKERLLEDLKDKKQRDAFVSAHIDTGIPFQIRALREQRKWNQKELGDKAGDIAQETISRLEDPNYSKFTITTLKRIASAFDVALMVRFVPFSELVEWELNLSPESLEALSFDQESYFKEQLQEYAIPSLSVTDFSTTASVDKIIPFPVAETSKKMHRADRRIGSEVDLKHGLLSSLLGNVA